MERLPMDALVPRRIYRIRSRNLLVGAWNPETSGFIGIREKFGSDYLFTEYHWDHDPHFGTVSHMEPTEHTVPEDVDMVEGYSLCQLCREPGGFVYGDGWHHDARSLDADHDPRSAYYPNEPLFDLLKPLTEEVVRGLR